MVKRKPIPLIRRIRREIERWLSRRPKVRIPAEVIIDYLNSRALPTVIEDDGVEWNYNFYPDAADQFALLWAECWLSRNPDAEINDAEGWARAVAGGNQILAKLRRDDREPEQ
jgi:hypothetical protein